MLWEYRTVTFTMSSRWSQKGQEQERDAFDRTLDEHGDEAWELVQYTAIPITSGSKVEKYEHSLIFRREATAATDGARSAALDRYLAASGVEYQRIDAYRAVYLASGGFTKQGHLVIARRTGAVKNYAIPAGQATKMISESRAGGVPPSPGTIPE